MHACLFFNKIEKLVFNVVCESAIEAKNPLMPKRISEKKKKNKIERLRVKERRKSSKINLHYFEYVNFVVLFDIVELFLCR